MSIDKDTKKSTLQFNYNMKNHTDITEKSQSGCVLRLANFIYIKSALTTQHMHIN